MNKSRRISGYIMSVSTVGSDTYVLTYMIKELNFRIAELILCYYCWHGFYGVLTEGIGY